MDNKRKRFLTDHPMTTGYIEKREFYEKLEEERKQKELDKKRTQAMIARWNRSYFRFDQVRPR
jgi:hypothetical protein